MSENPGQNGQAGATADSSTQGGLGGRRLVSDFSRRRERFRQFVGIAFVFAITFLGHPRAEWWTPALVLAGVGMLIRIWASGFVKKDKQLATEGPYALVRHPLYVGNLLIGFGFCLASGLWWSFAAWILILVFFYPPAIRQEDEKLHALFGETWARWRASTMALVPTLPPAGPLTGRWSFRQSLIENGEPVYVVIFCALLFYLSWWL